MAKQNSMLFWIFQEGGLSKALELLSALQKSSCHKVFIADTPVIVKVFSMIFFISEWYRELEEQY